MTVNLPALFFIVVTSDGLRTRNAAGLRSVVLPERLREGNVVQVDPASVQDKDGYTWWMQVEGKFWVAEKTAVAGEEPELLMKRFDPSTVRTIALPNGGSMQPQAIIQALPVALEQTVWTQYFGNTRFAYNLSVDRDPRRRTSYYYCQALHGGIDFGSEALPDVFSGVEGVVTQVSRNSKSYTPNFVSVKVGRFTLIYGHISDIPAEMKVNDPVHVGTRIGKLARQGAQGSPHLHFEVRYDGIWIINPLMVMPDDMVNAFMARFPNFTQYFYSDNGWSKWLTPLDQPVLRLSAKETAVILGPSGGRG